MEIISISKIEGLIYIVRDRKVILDKDLATLYNVEVKRLNEQVKRNIKRFPQPDFMFQLNIQEFTNLKSQIATSSWGGSRKLPFAFTEMGVAMLSSVLNSDRAIQVNIQIMKTFTKLREMLLSNELLRLKIENIERKYDHQFKIIFDAIKKIIEIPAKPKRKIGCKI